MPKYESQLHISPYAELLIGADPWIRAQMIRRRREAVSIPQHVMAGFAGISVRTYIQAEQHGEGSEATLYAIAAALEASEAIVDAREAMFTALARCRQHSTGRAGRQG